MEKPVLMLTKKAIQRISHRVSYYNYFFELLLKLQDYVRILEYESILLIDKNYADKIKNRLSKTNNSTELSMKPFKITDLERMFGYFNTVTILENPLQDRINESENVFNEIETFYASSSNFEIIFERYYDKLLEIELKCRDIKTKIDNIKTGKRYEYENSLLDTFEFKNFINSEIMNFKNGIISNEKDENLVIDNYYSTNIRLSLRWFADSSEENFIDDIKCFLEKYMPCLAQKTLKLNDENPFPYIKIKRDKNGNAESGTNPKLYIFFMFVNKEVLKKEKASILNKWFGISTERFQKTITEIENDSLKIYKEPKYKDHAKKVKQWIEQTENLETISKFRAAYPHLY